MEGRSLKRKPVGFRLIWGLWSEQSSEALSPRNAPESLGRSSVHSIVEMDMSFSVHSQSYLGFPGGTNGKEPACQCKIQRRQWV